MVSLLRQGLRLFFLTDRAVNLQNRLIMATNRKNVRLIVSDIMYYVNFDTTFFSASFFRVMLRSAKIYAWNSVLFCFHICVDKSVETVDNSL